MSPVAPSYEAIAQQASQLAESVAGSVGDAVSAVGERLPNPQVASEWSRAHVPGLTPPKRRTARPTTWISILAVIAAAGVVWWWLQDRDDNDESSPH